MDLLRLLRSHLGRYRPYLTAVVVLQFIGVVVMLSVSLVQIVCAVTAVWFGARTAMGFGRDLRRELFHRVGSFSTREFQQFGAPSLITRTTNDVQQVQMLVL